MINLTLQRKISVTIVLIGLILGLVLSSIVYIYLYKTLSSQKVEELTKLNTEQVLGSTKLINNYQMFAKMLSTGARVKEYLQDNKKETKSGELTTFFNNYIKDDSNYLAIYLLDKNGTGLVSTDDRFVGQNYSFRTYFKGALLGQPMTDVSIGKTSKKFGYYFSHPVVDDNGSVLGVLVVKIDNKGIDKDIFESQIAKNNTVMLVDQYGIILFSNNQDRYLKSLGTISQNNQKIIEDTERVLGQKIEPLQYESVQKTIEANKKSETLKFYDGIDKDNEIISISQLTNLPLYLVVEIGDSDIDKLILSTIFMIITMILIMIVLFTFTILKLIGILMHPLKEFKILSQAISNGDFSKKIILKTKDEFGDLANTFNDMTTKLKESYGLLELKIKERTWELEEEKNSLEFKIKQRTKELESLKNHLEKEVEERTLNLNSKLDELKQINKLMVGRELMMIKLKEEMSELKGNAKSSNGIINN